MRRPGPAPSFLLLPPSRSGMRRPESDTFHYYKWIGKIISFLHSFFYFNNVQFSKALNFKYRHCQINVKAKIWVSYMLFYLFIDRLVASFGRSATMCAAILLARPRRRIGMTISGFKKWTGTRVAGFAVASRQRRRVLTRGWRDRLPALY